VCAVACIRRFVGREGDILTFFSDVTGVPAGHDQAALARRRFAPHLDDWSVPDATLPPDPNDANVSSRLVRDHANKQFLHLAPAQALEPFSLLGFKIP